MHMSKIFHLLAVLALPLVVGACGGGSSGTPFETPALSATAPQNTYDLSNYVLTGSYLLPVAPSAANKLAHEASAVTYNKDTDTLFVVGDGGTSIVQVTKTGVLVDSMQLAAGTSPQGTYFYDPEGISYIGNGKFVMVEERDRQVNEFSYVAGSTLSGANVRKVKLGTSIGNIGIEGLSFDPMTGGYVLVKEATPVGVFQSSIDFASGTASNGSPTTVNSINLFDPAKTGLSTHSDVYAVSNILASTAPDYSHLLVLSAPDGKIVKIDRSGNIQSTLAVSATAKIEGMTMDGQGNLYIVSEEGGGSIDRPQLQVYSPRTSKSAMSIGSNLYLTFNQPIMAATGSITLSNGAGDTRTIAITDTTQVTISGNTLKINPATDLVAGSTYGVSYPAGVIKDADGREAPALSSSTISLSTLPDILAPELASSLPSDDAAGVTGNHIVLTFNEPVKAGTGSIYISNGLGDLRNIAVSDITQVTISGKTVDINPSVDLIKGLTYNVQMASGVIKDQAGNNFAGLTSPTALNFSTMVSSSTPTALITEVNSNAVGGDFFELFNYGATEIDLSGWKWDDDSANPASGATFPPGTKIAAGQRIVVLTESIDAASFKTAWGGLTGVTVVTAATAPSGLGLGGSGDAVVLFDASGRTITWFNYKTTNIISVAADATVLTPAEAATGVTRASTHAGQSFGAALATTSAVWDGVSVMAPKYKSAVVGELNAIASGVAIGSPGN